ncbi:MAG: Yip1 family protein, partial [Acidobacteriota bacterium]
MDLVQRVKNICLTPNTEWPVIEAEPTTAGALVSGYLVPLAGIGAIAGFIGGSIIGYTVPFIGGTYRTPFVVGLGGAVFMVVMAVVGAFVLSYIINALAPTFGGTQNSDLALKVAVYSYTPALVAAVLKILPSLGTLAGLIGGLYALYLLYLGLPRLMKCPPDKAVPYTAVVVICAIVLGFVIAAIGTAVVGAGMMGSGALGGMTGRREP